MVITSLAFAFASMGITGQYTQNAFTTSISPYSWSGALNHMTCSLHKTQPYAGNEQIIAANGQRLSIVGIGTITLNNTHNQPFTLSNVHFVPPPSANLIFVGQLVDNGYSIQFSSFVCVT